MARYLTINNFICYFLGAIIWLFFLRYAQAAKVFQVGVVFPDIREPYRTVFMDIIGGIEKHLGFSVHHYTINEEKNDANLLNEWIDKNQIQAVIVLGKQGIDQVKTFPRNLPVIAGAVLEPPNKEKAQISGITLAPDPYELFKRLKKLAPQVKRVIVVYDAKQSGWLMAYAERAAAEHNLELKAFDVKTLVEAASVYRTVLESKLGITDAIWLPQDNISADQKTILPMLLKEAWDRSFIVFSSNPSSVKRGVLFSLYPDNEKLGASLGELATRVVMNKIEPSYKFKPLKDLLIVVNIRTAEHLRLKLSQSDINSFDLVFPSSH